MKPHPKVNPPSIALCPHCGNVNEHRLLHRQDFYKDVGEYIDQCWWAILECSTCTGLSLYTDQWDETHEQWTSKLIYPIQMIAPAEAPKTIQRLFYEALSVKHRVPSLSAVGIRKCLEAICRDKGATKTNLASSIRELGAKGILPETLVTMMDSSRIIGNLGAHATSGEVAEEDANILVDFCLAILEYVYVAPNKIASIEKRLGSLKSGRK